MAVAAETGASLLMVSSLGRARDNDELIVTDAKQTVLAVVIFVPYTLSL